MKDNDLLNHISYFFSRYLSGERGLSKNTIASYRYTFLLLMSFFEGVKKINTEKLPLKKITRELILEFLDWLQSERGCENSTRNNRLAAIHSFYHYLGYQNLESIDENQRILSIRCKKNITETPRYLTLEGIALLLRQPDQTTPRGRRDLTLLSLMYDTGARVQEMVDLTPSAILLNKPYVIKLHGKGNKVRLVPMLPDQVIHLKNYLNENGLSNSSVTESPLFFNSRGEKLTREGVSYIVLKYVKKAKKEMDSLIPKGISCHSIRHSKAMHLQQAKVNLIYIRDFLGHKNISTTEIYARADSQQKRDALEKGYKNVNPNEKPIWEGNSSIIAFLKGFKI